MDGDTKGRKFKSKKRQKLEKLKTEAKRRKLKAKSKVEEKENLKEIAMGARLKTKSKFKEDLQEMGLDGQVMGARRKIEANTTPAEAVVLNGEVMMGGRKKKACKAKSKEKVDLKKLFRVS